MKDSTHYRLGVIRRYIITYGNEDAYLAKSAVLEMMAEMVSDIEEQILEDIRRNGT